ncbi:hypothetical protein [Pseudomonas sp. B21-035]|uniref:hypothetical protein n=1 Tax=Pseudomonas sp. B21-035 TaxID=2895484 RepID=UPI002160279B|nr:hypothetical protein [Pseudomonas sp. B21-035]UVL56240.1 hypothetical protein LOY22_26045 [Pseudomonas sp. B21-035]
MGVPFFEELSEGARPWQILGARNLLIDHDQGRIQVEIFCFSPPVDHISPKYRRKIKAFKAPLSALRHLAAGSVWREGVRVRNQFWIHHVADIIVRKCELISSDSCESTEELLAKLRKSKNPHATFLKSINYLRYEHRRNYIYIPCSEVLRNFLAPTSRVLKMIVTGNVENLLNPNKCAKLAPLLDVERRAIELYRSSEAGLSAARHPYKSIKLTHLANVRLKRHAPFLLSAKLPFLGIHALWTYRSMTVELEGKMEGVMLALLENEPQGKRASAYREIYQKSWDLGPHQIHPSDILWPLAPKRTVLMPLTEESIESQAQAEF